jgi:hypothetical protein
MLSFKHCEPSVMLKQPQEPISILMRTLKALANEIAFGFFRLMPETKKASKTD